MSSIDRKGPSFITQDLPLFAVITLVAVVIGGGFLQRGLIIAEATITGTTPAPRPALTYLRAFLVPEPPALFEVPFPGWLHWTLIIVVVALLVTGVLWVASLRSRRPANYEHRDGLASRHEIERAVGTRQLMASAATIRCDLRYPDPSAVGFKIGAAKGVDAWFSYEMSWVLIGPSRSGKGVSFVIPIIAAAPGAVVTTSTRPDNLNATVDRRRKRGPVRVFDPGDLTGDTYTAEHLRFNIVAGCEDPDEALRRVYAFGNSGNFGEGGGSGNGGFWKSTGESIAQCLLHAAALDGGTVEQVFSWLTDRVAAQEAVQIMREDPRGDKFLAAQFDARLRSSGEQAMNEWAAGMSVFDYLRSVQARRWLIPDQEHPSLNVAEFIATGGTLYLLGGSEATKGVEKIVAGLVEEFRYVGSKMAGRSASQHLTPPCVFVFDEAANFHIDALPALISEGGGKGQPTVAVFQAKRQLGVGYEAGVGETMWGSAAARVILGGMYDADDARGLETIVGTRQAQRESISSGGGQLLNISSQTSLEDRPILTAAEIARIPRGQALILRAGAAPFVARVQPYWERDDIHLAK